MITIVRYCCTEICKFALPRETLLFFALSLCKTPLKKWGRLVCHEDSKIWTASHKYFSVRCRYHFLAIVFANCKIAATFHWPVLSNCISRICRTLFTRLSCRKKVVFNRLHLDLRVNKWEARGDFFPSSESDFCFAASSFLLSWRHLLRKWLCHRLSTGFGTSTTAI